MMRSAVVVAPGSLDIRTGGYIYDRRIVDGLRALGWSIEVRELDDTFPWPSPAALEHAERTLASIPAGTLTIIDSLALGAMPAVIVSQAARLRIVALVHLPLAADVGLDREVAAQFALTERIALEAVAMVIVTGRATLPLLAGYELSPSRIVVIEPGTDATTLSRGSSGSPLQLLSVATFNPCKGHQDLLEALATVPSRNWHLTCAGSLTRHPLTVEHVRATVSRLDLGDRVSLVGELEAPELEECYTRSDLFVLATRQETYGMAVAEALAHGLPVVSTVTGAIPDMVGDSAGLLVAPGDTEALSEALSRVLGDSHLRRRLAEGARRARLSLPRWEHASQKMAAALESISNG